MKEKDVVCYLVEFNSETFNSIPYNDLAVAEKEMECRKNQDGDKDFTVVRKEHFDDFCMDYINLFMY